MLNTVVDTSLHSSINDVLLPVNFTEAVIEKYLKVMNCVVYHYVYGKAISIDDPTAPQLLNYTSKDIDKKTLSGVLEWKDYRDNILGFHNDSLNSLKAPWAYGWSVGLTIDRKSFFEVDGFTEDFKGWGIEDTDLCYKLYRRNVRF